MRGRRGFVMLFVWMAGMVIALVVLGGVWSFFFSGGGLFDKIGRIADNVQEPVIDKTGIKEELPVEEAVRTAVMSLRGAFRDASSTAQSRCLVAYDRLPEKFGRNEILIRQGTTPIASEESKKGLKFFVRNERGQLTDIGLPIGNEKSGTCIVGGDAAARFYDYWFDGTVAVIPATREYEAVERVTLPEAGKLVQDNAQEYRLDKNRPLLYKADTNNVCFVTASGKGDCSVGGNPAGIGAGCLEDATEYNLWFCDDLAERHDVTVDASVEEGARRLADVLEAAKGRSATECLEQYDFSGVDFDRGKIALVKEGDAMEVYAVNNDNRRKFIRSIGGLEPCTVTGSDAPRNFYYKWIELGSPGTANRKEYNTGATRIVTVKGEDEDGLSSDERTYNLKKGTAYQLLYKADANHVCFMPSWDDTWNSVCSRPDGRTDGIDNDCFGELWKHGLLECGT